MEPRLQPHREAQLYELHRSARNRVLVTRSGGGEPEVELFASSRPWAVSWTEVARTILDDALEEPPVRKLTQDYGRFLFTPVGETRTVTGAEIGRWISSWSLPRFPGETVRPTSR